MGLIKILIGSKAGKRIILVKAFEEPNDIAKLTVRVVIHAVWLLDFDAAYQLNAVLNKKK